MLAGCVGSLFRISINTLEQLSTDLVSLSHPRLCSH